MALSAACEPGPQGRASASRSRAGHDLAAAFEGTALARCLRDQGFTAAAEAHDLRGRQDALVDGVVAVSDQSGNVVTAGWDEQDGFSLSGPGASAKEDAAIRACQDAAGR